ncbi:phosphoinositide 3-kinase adapter protein 1 [Topomyia yanbarensis]|uniref:phosphoinositide 3-kinase adapter protein 1 n=1 Tax=Topomyia yanbarensis TaxID=2498891 RepID=UPI00273A9407|nr:phosphoinositide 3-kinase adapter protein 1 [Topomyia yanbarensis]
MFSDNPNYFDEEVAARSGDSADRSFFLFKKQNSKGKIVLNKQTNLMQEQSTAHKRRGSWKSFIRSRNNSTTTEPAADTHVFRRHNTLDYKNCENGSLREQCFYYNTSESEYTGQDVNERGRGSDSFEPRRHSIGTFSIKEQFSDEVPKMMAPKAPVGFARRHGEGDRLPTTVDDILFVTARHNEQALIWVNHLKTCFDKITKQRGKLPFNFLQVKIDEDPITPQLVQRCLSTKLQIVIVCPILLTMSGSFLLSTLRSLLKPERVLGLLLEVTEERMREIHKVTFPEYNKWRTCVAGSHEQSFLSELLGTATDILGRALRQQPLCSEMSSQKSGQHSTSTGQHETFTLFPRKVKIGYNKIVAILTEPLEKNDWIKIKIEKGNEVIEITNVKRRNPFTIQFSIPETCMEISMMVGVRLLKNNEDMGSRPLKCESRFRELEQILKAQDAPMEFLCQAVGIATSDRDKLDSYLLQSFQKNLPPNFHLLNSADTETGMKLHSDASPEKYPTLLHFAAYWGLERLCLQVMDCPGGDTACQMRNISGHTPVDLAELGGHYKLASSFKNFSQMHEFTTMYHYFKGISESAPHKVVIEPKAAENCKNITSPTLRSLSLPAGNVTLYTQSEGYMEMNDAVMNETEFLINQRKEADKDKEILDNMDCKKDETVDNILINELKITEADYLESNDINKNDSFSQECSNLLENCNVSDANDFNYLIQPSNVPLKQMDVQGDYLVQPSNIPVHEYSNLDYRNQHRESFGGGPPNGNHEAEIEVSHLRLSFKKKESQSESQQKNRTLKRQESNTSKKSVDDELLEIITDFKNNVFTIQEVEQLVDLWKSRNDVQKSFKEKQEQLQTMREEYERIQQQMKERLKRPTPFEKIKNMFQRHKTVPLKKGESSAQGPPDVCDDIKFSMTASSSSQTHRPISSSSLHSISSSSSGRMSTPGGATIGEAGAHSDSEEHRIGGFNNVNQFSTKNYSVPRAGGSTHPSTPVEENEQPSFLSTLAADEHYMIFPSNIPVSQATSPMLNSIDETKEVENLVQPIKIQKQSIIYSQLEDSRPTVTTFRFKTNDSEETLSGDR